MIKTVEEYHLTKTKLYIVKEAISLNENGPRTVIYKIPTEPLTIKRFLDTDNYVHFVQNLIDTYKLISPGINGKISLPAIRITNPEIEYRFVCGDECVSFTREIDELSNSSYVKTEGVKPYYHGINFINSSLEEC